MIMASTTHNFHAHQDLYRTVRVTTKPPALLSLYILYAHVKGPHHGGHAASEDHLTSQSPDYFLSLRPVYPDSYCRRQDLWSFSSLPFLYFLGMKTTFPF